MKIAFVSPGNSIHEKKIAEKAVQRGHEVALISTRWENPCFSVPGVRFFHYFPHIPRLKTIPIVFYLKRMLKDLKPDLMLSSLPVSDGFSAALTGFHPHIAFPWGTDILHIPYISWLARKKTAFTLHQADVVLCMSSAIRDRVLELSPGAASNPQIVNLAPIDTKIFTPEESSMRNRLGWQDKKVLIMTRTPFPVFYGVEFFIEALPLILKEEPDTRIIMIGSGSLDKELRARVMELGIQDKVHFVGRVDNTAMPEYLNASDIYVSMSFSDGSSVSLLEAMACGLPVVVSQIPANTDWIVHGENGLLVSVGDYSTVFKSINRYFRKHPQIWEEKEASSRDFPMPVSPTFIKNIASALVTLLRDRGAQKEMGKRNRQVVCERGDLDVEFAKFEHIAQELIANGRAPIRKVSG